MKPPPITHREFSRKGGNARARVLTRQRRLEIATQAALVRWAKVKAAKP